MNKISPDVLKGHEHMQISMKLKKKVVLILREGNTASILRVCAIMKTNPSIRAQERETKH